MFWNKKQTSDLLLSTKQTMLGRCLVHTVWPLLNHHCYEGHVKPVEETLIPHDTKYGEVSVSAVEEVEEQSTAW